MEKTRKQGLMALAGLLLALLLVLLSGTSVQAATKPGKVVPATVTTSAYNKVTVTWAKTTNASLYRIYYRKDGDTHWTKINSVKSTETSYTHKSSTKYPIVVGQKYYYSVRAYNSTSKKYGDWDTTGIAVKTKPDQVANYTVTVNGSTVTINWSKAGGADRYIIYRKYDYTKNGGGFTTKWAKLATVNADTLKYTDSNPVKGEDSYYTVRSYYKPTKAYGKYDKEGKTVHVSQKTNTVALQSISANSGSGNDTIIKSNGSKKYTVKYYPENATNKAVTWSSSDPSVATVANGVVTPLKSGKTTITVKGSTGCSFDIKVTVVDVDSMIQQAIELTNQARVANGKPQLKTNANLQKAAMIRAEEISRSFSHLRPGYTKTSLASANLITETGAAHYVGENIAAGYSTASAAINGWMNSSGHRLTMMSLDYTYVAIGIYIKEDGNIFWAQAFANGNPDDRVTLTFNTMGGNYIEPIIKPAGGQTDLTTIIPTKIGYTFEGWYSSSQYRTRLTGCSWNTNATVYAKWSQNP